MTAADLKRGHRATATPSQRQSYFLIVPVSADGLVCPHYWPPSRAAKEQL